MIDTPECDKLHKVTGESQTVGEFLEWLQEHKKLVLAEYLGDVPGTGRYELFPSTVSIEKLLAEYFDIDLDKVEHEKMQVLELQRELNNSYRIMEALG